MAQTPSTASDLDQIAINTIRFLAVDMVEQANSGHPGAPMGQAALAYRLWSRHLRFDPTRPDWPNRDRFVLSCGHASALIYGLLHLAGYDLPMEELENFRQLGSKTPGHPEYGLTPGVETTTGPLGQGVGNAVGMAVAERLLADALNRDGFPLFDHRTWVLASDGDLMEGVAAEASSLAGHLGLGKLIVFYDANEITIDGSTELSFTEDVAARYAAIGWHILRIEDGNDLEAIDRAAEAAVAETARPTLVVTSTHIGFGSPAKQDTSAAHGAPLGPEEVKAAKNNLGWPLEPTFHVPPEAREAFAAARQRGAKAAAAWDELCKAYRERHPEATAELDRRLSGDPPADWEAALPTFRPEDGPLATRKASGAVLNSLVELLPELVGGSADLAGSNNTTQADRPFFSKKETGPNFHFGVREHAMGAAMNGMVLSGMLRPYGGTFLIFSDYMRPSIRLAALMGLPAIYVLTHDSIFLGEDGPTHQPISQLAALRAIPNLEVFRPADANETAAAWREAVLRRQGPTALVLSRQKLPILDTPRDQALTGVERGAYVVADAPAGTPRVMLLATGSEVSLALGARERLQAEGIPCRVVSMPCWRRFEAQDDAYREEVLPPSVTARLGIEAGASLGWDRYVGPAGAILAQDGFGESAPYADLARHFGFTEEEVVHRAKALL